MKATVLCENRVYHKRGLVAEHGWSVFLETPAGDFLFDTGQGAGIVYNAAALGKDLASVKGIILSHRHWDHTGGLPAVLAATGPVDVFAHPGIFDEAFKLEGDEARPVGIPASRRELESAGARFRFNRTFTEIAPGLFLTGEVPRKTGFEKGDPRLVVRRNGGFAQDALPDDQALVAPGEGGLFVLLGCSHSGVVNTLRHATASAGDERIALVMGGTHLGPLPGDEAEATIRALLELDIGRIGASHCTGLKPGFRLMEAFGKRFFFCCTGDVVDTEDAVDTEDVVEM
jgi:7,8-dihydropterin-6-yl-methyl-4-(beta-D-ribofuranosyl)aminobenzene 5'-phosphate synthase